MDLEKIKELYNILADDESKEIFKHRLCFSISEEKKDLQPIIDIYKQNLLKCFRNHKTPALEYYITSLENKKIVLYGAGQFSIYHKMLIDEFCKGACIVAFMVSERNAKQDSIDGIPVVSVDRVCEFKDCQFVVTPLNRIVNEEICEVLKKNVPEKNIMSFSDFRRDAIKIYQEEFVKYSDSEVFLDGGAFDGESFMDFANRCENYRRIIAMEPDNYNADCCEKKNQDRVEIIRKGLYKNSAVLSFIAEGGCGSRMAEEGNCSVDVISIDEIFEEKDYFPTYIKMDIEGCELEAILGGENTIKIARPKLAISVYHKPEDVVEIPWLIHKFVPEYKFYLRHYTFDQWDTVLYCVI